MLARLSINSFFKFRPTCTNKASTGKAKARDSWNGFTNRRCEWLLVLNFLDSRNPMKPTRILQKIFIILKMLIFCIAGLLYDYVRLSFTIRSTKHLDWISFHWEATNQCSGPLSYCDVQSGFVWFMDHEIDLATLKSYDKRPVLVLPHYGIKARNSITLNQREQAPHSKWNRSWRLARIIHHRVCTEAPYHWVILIPFTLFSYGGANISVFCESFNAFCLHVPFYLKQLRLIF